MTIRAFCQFLVHLRIAHPVRFDLLLATVFSFWPVDQIHRSERRLDFGLFGVFFLHDIAIADAFACRLDRERPAPTIAVLE